jgi:phosphoglycolate phosphatase
MSTTAVIFDMDGVLVDSRVAITSSMNHALTLHGGTAREPSDLYRMIGPPIAVAFGELLGLDPSDQRVAAHVAAYREHHREGMLVDSVVMPGIAEVLPVLAQRHALGVATSKPRAFAQPLLEALGLAPHFAVIAGPELSTVTPDKADLVATALQALKPSGGAVMVGDRKYDVEGAHAHGVPAIGVLWGMGPRAELEDAGADALIDDASDLPAVVTSLIAAGAAVRKVDA